MLNDVKVLIRPRDERMRELISLRAFGLSELDAVRYYVYSSKGRLRADDLLVRERVARGLAEASARLRDLASQWRADGFPRPPGRTRSRRPR